MPDPNCLGNQMTERHNIPQVFETCKISNEVKTMSRVDQVEHLSLVATAEIEDARIFFGRNYITSGMAEFLKGALKRLSGQSNQAIFELRQAMGGGKTHNMIALGLLAKFPELISDFSEEFAFVSPKNPASIALVNGRDVENYIWGDIAIQLKREDDFQDHWSHGPREMNESDWIRMIGETPTLILLDELSPYFEVANTREIAKGTLLDKLKFSISNLYTAAMKLQNCVVVISSLESAYQEAQKILSGQLVDLQKETSRGAKSIIPVDLSTNEIYDILRKRLFSEIPDSDSQDVEQVVTAYKESYLEAIEGRALAKSAELLADEIQNSYPFHPSYKDILALFKENEKFRQTRGLLQFSANLLRRIWENQNCEIFLIGAQYLDFSDAETREQINEIESTLASALARDVYSTGQSAHAQVIDSQRGDPKATQIATLLFVSSLSDNIDGIRGIPINTVIEYLVTPGVDTAGFMEVFEILKKECWYLHNRDEDRWYFSNIANVRKQIQDKMIKVSQDQIDVELRRKLTEIFKPYNCMAYSELAVLPLVSDVSLSPTKRTCLVLSPDAMAPPEVANKLYEESVYKNTFCVVSGDGSKMGNAEECVRRLIAIESIKSQIPDNPRHQKEIEDEQKNSEIDFSTTVKSLFNTVWYPHSDGLKSVRIDLGHFQESGEIYGERAVEESLTGGSARKLIEISQDEIDKLVDRCEEQLFPKSTNRIPWTDIIERSGNNPQWIWLPPKGLDEIKSYALDMRRWVEDNGIIDRKPPPPVPVISVIQLGVDENSGESDLEITVSNSGQNPEIYVADTCEKLKNESKLDGYRYQTKEVEHWFQVKNLETDEKSEPYHWRGKITITHERQKNVDSWLVTLNSIPNAELRWNITGINPKEGSVYDGNPIELDGSNRFTLYVYAEKGTVSATNNFKFEEIGGEIIIDKDIALVVNQNFQFANKELVNKFFRATISHNEVEFQGISLTVGNRENSISVRSRFEVKLNGQAIEEISTTLRKVLGEQELDMQLSIMKSNFSNWYEMRDVIEKLGIDVNSDSIEQ